MIGETAMQVNPYLSFKGDCEDAFRFYERCLGATVGTLYRYGGTPLADSVPPDWQDKIMHGSVTFGDQMLMAGDVAPDRYEAPKGFSFSIHLTSVDEAERIFGELAENGRILMALEKTFWAARFGMVVDRFAIQWMINCEEPAAAG